MTTQPEFIYMLSVGDGKDSMFMGVFKTKESAEAYAMRNKEDGDSLHLYCHQGLALIKEQIVSGQEWGDSWSITEAVLHS